jgi:hypothetical protein
MKLFKKGEMPWWLITLITAVAILLLILLINADVTKSIFSNIATIFGKW